jgi:hypothetical protein
VIFDFVRLDSDTQAPVPMSSLEAILLIENRTTLSPPYPGFTLM